MNDRNPQRSSRSTAKPEPWNPAQRQHLWLSLLLLGPLCPATEMRAAERAAMFAPEDFPQFIVPGHEKEMQSLRELFWLHYQPAGPLITLWDEWMPMSTLWPARGAGPDLEQMRKRWASALASRGINADGYVRHHV